MSIWRRQQTRQRVAIRLEGGWVWVEVGGNIEKPLLRFPAGNFDYVLGRGEPLFRDDPELVARVSSLITYARENALSGLPNYVWHPVTIGNGGRAPLADRILLFFLSREEVIAIPGDIEEKLPEVRARLGEHGARMWYRKELAVAVLSSFWRRLEPLFRFAAAVLRISRPFD